MYAFFGKRTSLTLSTPIPLFLSLSLPLSLSSSTLWNNISSKSNSPNNACCLLLLLGHWACERVCVRVREYKVKKYDSNKTRITYANFNLHSLTHYLTLSLFLSLSLFLCLCLYLSFYCICLYLSFYVSVSFSLFFFHSISANISWKDRRTHFRKDRFFSLEEHILLHLSI